MMLPPSPSSHPKVVVFLGAGASAIGGAAPLTHQLLDEVPYFDGSKRRQLQDQSVFDAWTLRQNHGATSIEQWFSELQGDDGFVFGRLQQLIARRITQSMNHSETRRGSYGGLGLYRSTGVPELEELWQVLSRLPNFSVITPNYDVHAERGLRLTPTRKRPGFHYDSAGELLVGSVWPGTKTLHTLGSVPVRKLHGSVSWKLGANGLIEHYVDCRPGVLGSAYIVPPVLEKNQPPLFLESTWRLAAIDLRSAARLIIIGYSAPKYDLAIRALVKENISSSCEIDVFDIDARVADNYNTLLAGRTVRFCGPLPSEIHTLKHIVSRQSVVAK
jgi:hypothetical protein